MTKTRKQVKSNSLKKINTSNIAKQNPKNMLNLKISSKCNQLVVENTKSESIAVGRPTRNQISILITSEMFDTKEEEKVQPDLNCMPRPTQYNMQSDEQNAKSESMRQSSNTTSKHIQDNLNSVDLSQLTQNVRVNISHTEFVKFALKHGALNHRNKPIYLSKSMRPMLRRNKITRHIQDNLNSVDLKFSSPQNASNIAPQNASVDMPLTTTKSKKKGSVLNLLQDIIHYTKPKETAAIKILKKPTDAHKLQTNDLVMAKMRGYCSWPARIIKMKGKRTDVFFFGTNQTGTVNTNQVTMFDDSHREIRQLLLRNKLEFKKAVKEVEIILNIPDHLSLLNNRSVAV